MNTEDNIRKFILETRPSSLIDEGPAIYPSATVIRHHNDIIVINKKGFIKRRFDNKANRNKAASIIYLYKDVKIDKVTSFNRGFAKLHLEIPWIYPFSILTGIGFFVIGIFEYFINDTAFIPYALGGSSIILVGLIGIFEIILKRRDLNCAKRI
jgi:hypothetical protein